MSTLAIDQTHRFRIGFDEDTGYIECRVTITGVGLGLLHRGDNHLVPTWSPAGDYIFEPYLLNEPDEYLYRQLEDLFVSKITLSFLFCSEIHLDSFIRNGKMPGDCQKTAVEC